MVIIQSHDRSALLGPQDTETADIALASAPETIEPQPERRYRIPSHRCVCPRGISSSGSNSHGRPGSACRPRTVCIPGQRPRRSAAISLPSDQGAPHPEVLELAYSRQAGRPNTILAGRSCPTRHRPSWPSWERSGPGRPHGRPASVSEALSTGVYQEAARIVRKPVERGRRQGREHSRQGRAGYGFHSRGRTRRGIAADTRRQRGICRLVRRADPAAQPRSGRRLHIGALGIRNSRFLTTSRGLACCSGKYQRPTRLY
jgi:hypothetical protein